MADGQPAGPGNAADPAPGRAGGPVVNASRCCYDRSIGGPGGGRLMGVMMDAQWIAGFAGGYVAAAVTVFLLYLPFLVLFGVLLLAAGLLELLALPFLVLFRRLRGRGKPGSSSGESWLPG